MLENRRAAARDLNPPRLLKSNHCDKDHSVAVGIKQQENESKKIIDIPKGNTMSNALAKKEDTQSAELSVIEQVVMQGDLSKLDPQQRVLYYRKVCESCGLNPYTRPFDYISLNGKLTLYAKKDCTEQLRNINGISIESLEVSVVDDLYIVKAKAKDKHGRTDESTGAVAIGHLKGEAKANAIMKAETKAKRRVTLSISGMAWTDETEVETIPHAKRVDIDLTTGEIKDVPKIEALPKPKEKSLEKLDRINSQQLAELEDVLAKCGEEYATWLIERMKSGYNIDKIENLTYDVYQKMLAAALKNVKTETPKIDEIEVAEYEPEYSPEDMQ